MTTDLDGPRLCPGCARRFEPPGGHLPPGRSLVRWSDGRSSDWVLANLLPPLCKCLSCGCVFWRDDAPKVARPSLRLPSGPTRGLGEPSPGSPTSGDKQASQSWTRLASPASDDWLAALERIEREIVHQSGVDPTQRKRSEELDSPRPLPDSRTMRAPSGPHPACFGLLRWTVRDLPKTLDLRLLLARRAEAAKRWVGLDNRRFEPLFYPHIESERILDTHLSEGFPSLGRQEILARLVDHHLDEGPFENHFLAAEYLREGGWFKDAEDLLVRIDSEALARANSHYGQEWWIDQIAQRRMLCALRIWLPVLELPSPDLRARYDERARIEQAAAQRKKEAEAAQAAAKLREVSPMACIARFEALAARDGTSSPGLENLPLPVWLRAVVAANIKAHGWPTTAAVLSFVVCVAEVARSDRLDSLHACRLKLLGTDIDLSRRMDRFFVQALQGTTSESWSFSPPT